MTDNPIPKRHRLFLPIKPDMRERLVRARFWRKFKRVVGRIPFADDLLAAYFCAMDPTTPRKVKVVLIAALAYFVIPTDLIPDFMLHFGFTDDLTVLTAAFGAVGGSIQPEHREQARAFFNSEEAA